MTLFLAVFHWFWSINVNSLTNFASGKTALRLISIL